MGDINLIQLLPSVEIIARGAGRLIMSQYNQARRNVRRKPDGSDVTPADEASERFIIDALKILTPNIPIVAEETAANTPIPEDGTFWTVDGLDGTTDFLEGLPGFGVAIALVIQWKTALGVIDHPALGWTFSGAGPNTASKFNADAVRTKISSIGTDKTDVPHRVLTTRYLAIDKVTPYLKRKWEENYDLVEAGHGVFGSCQVAERQAILSPVWLNNREDGRSSWWDVAPGHAIVESAGGMVETFDGEPFLYNAADRRIPPHVMYPG